MSEEYSKLSASEKKKEDWMNSKWRPNGLDVHVSMYFRLHGRSYPLEFSTDSRTW